LCGVYDAYPYHIHILEHIYIYILVYPFTCSRAAPTIAHQRPPSVAPSASACRFTRIDAKTTTMGHDWKQLIFHAGLSLARQLFSMFPLIFFFQLFVILHACGRGMQSTKSNMRISISGPNKDMARPCPENAMSGTGGCVPQPQPCCLKHWMQYRCIR